MAFVDVGGKGEATIEIDELKDDQGDLEVAVGDRIQAMVVSTAGGLTLSRKLARGAATARQLEDAFHTGLPLEGKVEKSVKGGYQVRIARQRAFCPISQMDTVRTDPSAHEGRVYAFRIIEYKEGGRNLVVSRRALLEEEQRSSAAEIRRSIAAGAVMTGRVTSVREFGAFVDLGGGVQGLPDEPPLSEVDRVATHGSHAGAALAVLLGAELDDPSSTNPRNVHVEQQAALALCKIYSVLPTAGETVRDARTTPQDNGHVNGFWRRKVSATKGHR